MPGSTHTTDARTPSRPALAAGAVAAAALAAASTLLILDRAPPEDRTLAAVVHALIVLVPAGVGLVALSRNRHDRFALLLLGAGLLWSLTSLAAVSDSTLHSVGRVAVWLVEPTIVYLLLAFPSGRLTTALERRLFTAALLLVTLLYLPTALVVERFPEPAPWQSCLGDCPANALAVTSSEPGIVEDVLRPVREVLTGLMYVAVGWVVVRRAQAAGPLLRRAVVLVAAVASCRALAFAAYAIVRAADPSAAGLRVIGWLYVLALPIIALSFGAGLVLRRLHAAVALQRLALELRASAGPTELREALARALEDPTLQLVYWREGDPGRWVDDAGWPVAAPQATNEVQVAEIRADGRRAAALVLDGRLGQDPELLRAAGSYALAVLENGRLVDRLSASLLQLSSSRSRLVAIADETRRRIERDLHDGAQQRLIALRIKLSIQGERLRGADPAAAAEIAALGDEVEEAIDELRALAHGIYPTVLGERGLTEALLVAARDAAIPTSVAADGVGRYRSEIESTVYFACLEALQNAEKHAAGASHVTIHLSADGSDPNGLSFEVRDDGAGFDAGPRIDGAGFQGLRDRLAAVGGTLAVRSAPGEGTCVAGRVPVEVGGPHGVAAAV